jgi:hypothetical protein
LEREKRKIRVIVTYAPMSTEREAQAARILSEMLLLANAAAKPAATETNQTALTDVATGYILKEVQGANP